MYITRLLRQRVILSLIFFLLAGIVIISTSYALFTKEVTDTTNQELSLGDLNITFPKGDSINIEDGKAVPDSISFNDPTYKYDLDITNNGDVSYTYKIQIKDNPEYLEGGSKYSKDRKLLSHDYVSFAVEGTTDMKLNTLYDGILFEEIINPGETISHDIYLWLTDKGLPNSALGSELHLKIMVDGKASPKRSEAFDKPDFGNDPSGANVPLLADNMIPVVYEEYYDKWIKADKNNQNTWYNYDKQVWANAITVKEPKREYYNNAEVGEEIKINDILGMWVWIPRYEYMTTNLGTSYAGGTIENPGEMSVKFVSGTNTEYTDNYFIHPAFRNGSSTIKLPNGSSASNYSQGGWDKELTGFWMSKFEADSTYGYITITDELLAGVMFVPSRFALNYHTLSSDYSIAQSVGTSHGVGSQVEPHMTKGDEWGAVAYLSTSHYGKTGNSDFAEDDKEIYLNNAFYRNSGNYRIVTGRSSGQRSTGKIPTARSYGEYEYNNCKTLHLYKTGCIYDQRKQNVNKGTGATTTGNIYGVYDMAGGLYNYVMLNYNGTIGESGFTEMPERKYWNKITNNSDLSYACNYNPCYGLGFSNEIGNGTENIYAEWYQDYFFMPTDAKPWVPRGSFSSNSPNLSSGIFDSGRDTGRADYIFGFFVSMS